MGRGLYGRRLTCVHKPQKWGLLCPFQRRAGSPSNTVWPGLRPTSVPSCILIHPTFWPQYTSVTDRTGERSDSIWRTVIQTVAQKWLNRSRCHLGCGFGWTQETCVTRDAHWRYLANTIEPFMCGGVAAFLSNYFDHLLMCLLGAHVILYFVNNCAVLIERHITY